MERDIFKYNNGEKEVFGDPMAIDRTIRARLGNPAKIIEQVNSIDLNTADSPQLSQGLQAQETMCVAVREAFGLKPFDPETGKGATESHCFAVWAQFVNFLDEKKNQPAT